VGSRSAIYYRPYVQAYQALLRTLEEVKHRRNEIDLGVASKKLASSLLLEQVPEIYFSLGERIHHYLVDEFQDTNPIQWATLRPLIEESLGKDGSLFIVGDTKQAIFTFRGGDWRIMNRMLTREEFASTVCHRLSLPLNYRSTEAVVDFARRVFHDIVPNQVDRTTAGLSGLTTYEQKVHKSARGTGYVEVTTFEPPEDATDEPPEKARLLQIIDECVARGYHHQDIAILTPKNASAVDVSGWLNTRGIRFLSHSSLDIRTRKITGEILALLRFLDSPIDDLAFASVLLGKIFSSAAGQSVLDQVREFLFEQRQSEDRSQALYTRFREIYPELWQRWFEHLFNVVGYLPVYDLVAEVYKVFSIFDAHGGEEATLVKLLDVIREFEAEGSNNLKDFLRYADTESADDSWNIAVARGEDAVTVMTIHKAKGLGFPVVILLLYDTFARPKVRFIEEDGDAVRVIRITRDWAEKNQELGAIYHRDKDLQQVDELNKLYVALTRAQEELYVLSIKGRSDAPSKFLPPGGFQNGTQRPHIQAAPGPARVAPIMHPPTRGLQQSPEGGRIGLEETKRGEFVHAVFSRITALAANPREQVDQAIEFHTHEIRQSFDVPAIREKILALLQNPDLHPFFIERPGRAIKNEQDVADSSGELFRLDRLVVDSDSVTVIDFKTGGESGEYFSQVKRYMKLAHELYPALPVQGFLSYLDLNAVRRVK
jgi:ATP-dependent helicase/nuclease subunit A